MLKSLGPGGLFGKFDTTYLRNSRHSGVRKFRREPCYPCIFLPCSDGCHCEMFITELTAQPTRLVEYYLFMSSNIPTVQEASLIKYT